MEAGKGAQEATESAVEDMTKRLNNTAGAITVSKTGDVGVHFSSLRMAWAYQKGGEIRYGIERQDNHVETIN